MGCRRGAQMAMHGSAIVPYLPLDVIAEILAKLSVKSLLQFRVVCKSWCSLISSHQFVKKYLSQVTTSPSRLIMNPFGLVNDLTFYHLHDSIVVCESSIDFRIEESEYCVMGSCDGLVCVKECHHGMIFLWNPSTRCAKILPCTSEVHGKVYELGWKYGFGHDCNSDDYKVLTLSPEENTLDKMEYFSYKSMMYTLGTDSWRRIRDSPLGCVFVDKSATFVSGALHWMADQEPSLTRVIISLDLTSETYIEVPQPDYEYSSELAEVGASRGCLCLLAYDNDEYYDIWVMNEYGVRESWTKSIKIPFMWEFLGCLKPLTWFIENGEIILSIGGNVASYNANRNSVRA
ncbi:putative F-box domain-containing protein [Rosa chinensis]|uniref:Putative F-box domain-containing protein n=1 Tax=Rosa chinensis TaxID=74649 RepID=A0A2P6Q9W1_ROSCH|nr:putative F-box domain-containing protein [Rosa chinensis]